MLPTTSMHSAVKHRKEVQLTRRGYQTIVQLCHLKPTKLYAACDDYVQAFESRIEHLIHFVLSMYRTCEQRRQEEN